MIQLLVTITVAVTLVATSASVFNPVHLKRLKETNECVGCELSKANLSITNLTYAFLYNANLRFADLSGANLSGAYLSLTLMNGAIFCNTTMPDGSVLYSGC